MAWSLRCGDFLTRQTQKAKQRGAESTAAELERQIAREGEKQKQEATSRHVRRSAGTDRDGQAGSAAGRQGYGCPGTANDTHFRRISGIIESSWDVLAETSTLRGRRSSTKTAGAVRERDRAGDLPTASHQQHSCGRAVAGDPGRESLL